MESKGNNDLKVTIPQTLDGNRSDPPPPSAFTRPTTPSATRDPPLID